jgi:hypothetical protein
MKIHLCYLIVIFSLILLLVRAFEPVSVSIDFHDKKISTVTVYKGNFLTKIYQSNDGYTMTFFSDDLGRFESDNLSKDGWQNLLLGWPQSVEKTFKNSFKDSSVDSFSFKYGNTFYSCDIDLENEEKPLRSVWIR